ncbi:hypothetical protein D3C71_1980570 [compost metagenome]
MAPMNRQMQISVAIDQMTGVLSRLNVVPNRVIAPDQTCSCASGWARIGALANTVA